MSKGSKASSYEWMVKYTPQKEWIEGKGLFLWLAWFFTEIFAGVYFISLFLHLKQGLFVGWIGALSIGGFFHLIYLGKMFRGWRILFKVSSSELSRGLWITAFYGAIGFLQLLPIVVPGIPWAWDNSFLMALMTIICVLAMIHGFLTMSVIKSLPMWNSPMMIPLSLTSALLVGSQILIFILLVSGSNITSVEVWARWSLLSYMGALLVYFWGNMHVSETARASVMRILAGDRSPGFYALTVVIGIMIPVIITIAIWGKGLSGVGGGYLFLRFLCVLIGDAGMRYSIMKAPYYTPLI